MVFSTLAKIVSSLVSLYMVLCIIRIFFSWIPSLTDTKWGKLIARLTDPYLNLFRGFSLFRTTAVDFSPIVALAVLSVLNNLFMTLSYAVRITLGFILSLLLDAAWSAISFVLGFFLVISVIRIIGFLARIAVLHPLWQILDGIINPLLFRINKIIYRGRAVQYLQGLITGFVAVLVVRALGGLLVRLLTSLLMSLPI
ncbi:MAG TPA: YggT family protein [Rectinema sp.]|jgi:YggT family protein|nr:YggT family protein [Spirochaetia bacterium]HAL94245.1 YggT family protein [Spirochaetaceae bacterium]HNV18776.1 YggT family protein [Rectinema sp.]HOD57933.1 YggT family protein [Rectinema sp.]HOM92257.1 YggT family protein [Rectinema sp.]